MKNYSSKEKSHVTDLRKKNLTMLRIKEKQPDCCLKVMPVAKVNNQITIS